MKRLTSYVVVASFATIVCAIAAPDKEAMMAKETAAWQAFKDKDAAAFQKLVDKDVVGVYAEGISGMANELADMKKWGMKSFKISDFSATSDDPNVFVTSYKVTIEGTFGGQVASGTYNCGSVWKMENGSWLAIFHTNIKAGGPATDAQKKE